MLEENSVLLSVEFCDRVGTSCELELEFLEVGFVYHSGAIFWTEE